MKRFMSMLILLLLGAVPLRAQTTESYELCNANGPCFVTSGGQSCGLGTPIIRIDDLQPGSSTASYQDSLASYAKVTHVRVTIPMTKLSPFTDTPAVTLALDGQPIGPPQTVTQSPGTCSGGFATYAFEQDFPSGMPNYVRSGENLLTVAVSGTSFGVEVATFLANVEVTWTPGVDIRLLAGEGQIGCVGSPTAQALRVQLSSAAGLPLAGKQVNFAVGSAPARATAVVGPDEMTGSATYTVTADAQGVAAATLVFGSQPGSYTVTAQSPDSVVSKVITFTAVAQKPAAARIFKDDEVPTTSLAQSDFAVSPVEQPSFHAYGIDASNHPIGPLKSGWSLGGGGSARGTATISPSSATSVTLFNPTRVGVLLLAANPVVSGIGTAKANVDITGVFVDVSGNFATTHKDETALFIPGSNINGAGLPLPAVEGTPIQIVTLHLLTPAGVKGTITYHLTNVTNYPGVAMNYPISNPGNEKDMGFANSPDPAGQFTDPLPFDASGDTATQVLIYDYAAYGHLTATISTGRRTFTIDKDLPLMGSNGLPLAGWFVNGTHIDPTGLAAQDDTDDQSSTTFSGQAGDGLSALEEMRGIVEAGTYTRLDPRRRDLFLVVDQNIFLIPDNPVSRLGTLGPKLHFLNLNEVVGEDYAPRALSQTKPVINPNRIGVPGARTSGQRAVRVIDQAQFYPTVSRTTYAGVAVTVFAHHAGIFGQTILDAQDPSQPADGFTAQSPDATRSVELYEQTYLSAAIHTPFASGPFGYVDASGNPTEPCLDPGNPPNCDNFDLPHHLILPLQLGPGVWADLHTIPTTPDDYYSLPGQRCDFPGELFDGGFTADMMKAQRGAVIAHEIGHAVHLDHTFVCDPTTPTMMYDRITDTAPLPTAFNQQEQNGVHLWQ